MTTDVQNSWLLEANKLLAGRTIKEVRLMPKSEQDALMWDSSPFVLMLDDGSTWYPSADDEGNNAGAFFGNKGKVSYCLPTMRA